MSISTTTIIVTPSSHNTGGRERQLEEGRKLLIGLNPGWVLDGINIEEHDDAGEESIPAPEPQTEMPVAKARFLSK